MFGWLKKKNIPTKVQSELPLEFTAWRNHMWVMTPDGIGIIFKLGVSSEVHLTDIDGLTIASKIYPTVVLRQAKFIEVPAKRRQFSKELAASMGYF